RTQSQRSQRSASTGRRCPQYGQGILSPFVGSGGAAGASVYSNFILTENHKLYRIRQANRIKNNRRRSPRADGSGRGHVESVRNSLGKDPGKEKRRRITLPLASKKLSV